MLSNLRQWLNGRDHEEGLQKSLTKQLEHLGCNSKEKFEKEVKMTKKMGHPQKSIRERVQTGLS